MPKIITKDNMKPNVHDLMVLLHHIKGFVDVFLFEDWMYHYIGIILKEK